MATTDEVGYIVTVDPLDTDPRHLESEAARAATRAGGVLTGKIEPFPPGEYLDSLHLPSYLIAHRWEMTRPRVA